MIEDGILSMAAHAIGMDNAPTFQKFGKTHFVSTRNFYQSRQSTTSIGVTHRMGVGECLFVTYWLLMYSCISCKLFSFAIVVK